MRLPIKNFFIFIIISVIINSGSALYARQEKGDALRPDKAAAFIYEAKGKGDPFNPLVDKEGRLLKARQEPEVKPPPDINEELVLEGIVYGRDGLAYAIIDSRVVRINDVINDYTVMDISAQKVTLAKDTRVLELELLNEDAQ